MPKAFLIKLRGVASTIASPFYRKTSWRPTLPADIDSLRQFCKDKLVWKRDPLHGYLDHIQPLSHLYYQLKEKGKVKGDCDDLATLICDIVSQMGYKAYRVNIFKARHVIAVIETENDFLWASNTKIGYQVYNSLQLAVEGYMKAYRSNITYEDINDIIYVECY